jgi:uncharacterized membrane protein (UPF0182 family)
VETTSAAPAAQPEQQPSPAQPAAGSEVDALAAEARAHYDRAIAAQRAGDWATYGEEIKRLGVVLEKMRRR